MLKAPVIARLHYWPMDPHIEVLAIDKICVLVARESLPALEDSPSVNVSDDNVWKWEDEHIQSVYPNTTGIIMIERLSKLLIDDRIECKKEREEERAAWKREREEEKAEWKLRDEGILLLWII